MTMGSGGIFGNPGGLFGRRKSPFERAEEMAGQFMPQIGPETQGAIDQYAAMPQQERKPGFFAQGGVGRAIAGYLGDALLRQADMDPIYAPSMMMQRKAELMSAQAEAERRAKFDDWRQQYDYERSNPKPSTAQPYRWESNDGSLMELGPDNQPRKVYADPTPKMNFIPDGMGGGRWVAVPTGGAPQPAATGLPEGYTIRGGATGKRPFDAPPQRLSTGYMTSGRRTPEGNRIVGGVPNSKHLTGEAADFVGADLKAVLAEARKLPGLRRAFIHKDHVHTEGDWNVPYFGKRGTAGLKGR